MWITLISYSAKLCCKTCDVIDVDAFTCQGTVTWPLRCWWQIVWVQGEASMDQTFSGTSHGFWGRGYSLSRPFGDSWAVCSVSQHGLCFFKGFQGRWLVSSGFHMSVRIKVFTAEHQCYSLQLSVVLMLWLISVRTCPCAETHMCF